MHFESFLQMPTQATTNFLLVETYSFLWFYLTDMQYILQMFVVFLILQMCTNKEQVLRRYFYGFICIRIQTVKNQKYSNEGDIFLQMNFMKLQVLPAQLRGINLPFTFCTTVKYTRCSLRS